MDDERVTVALHNLLLDGDWYDPQEHPNDASLASSFPHHQHVPPDIKHHRIPAPRLSFDHPNLPVLIAEVERLL